MVASDIFQLGRNDCNGYKGNYSGKERLQKEGMDIDDQYNIHEKRINVQ